MQDVEFVAPAELPEALGLLAERRAQATVWAGGTDLGPKLHTRELRPRTILYIGQLRLTGVTPQDGTLVIGAATSLDEVTTDPLLRNGAAVLAQAASAIGNPPIRNAATIGGNLATASPAADTAPPLLVLDAELVLASLHRTRAVPVGAFFKGPHVTVREPHELLTEIRIPPVVGRTAFLKLGRRKASSLSIVSVATRLDMDGSRCRDVRIAAGAVAPTPVRCLRAEEVLRGRSVTRELIAESASRAVQDCAPVDDGRASAWYRRRVIKVLVERALEQASGPGKELP